MSTSAATSLTGPVIVLSTVASREDAERIADALVEGRLAACVNVVPGLRSIYRWQGRVEHDDELLLVIKTRGERFEELCQAIRSLHTYEVPEMIALPIAGGHSPYLEWLDESTSSSGSPLPRDR